MARAVVDDMRAFEQLMRRYQTPLFAYLRRMLGAPSDAEDVFQETFLRVYNHRRRFRASAPFRPWLYRIATNLCKDRLRYRRRHPAISLETPQHADERAVGERLADQTSSPELAARRNELALRLQAAIDDLPVKQRTVFLLARYDGMPYEEIARVLRIPLGTVKSRMNTATQYLMDRLGEFRP